MTPPRQTRRELEIADHLWDCLNRIAEDNGADPQVVLNQAIYDLARRFNFLAPVSGQGAAPAMGKKPQTAAAGASSQSPQQNVRKPTALPPKATTAARETLYVVNSAGEMHKIEKDSFIIGRSRNCDLVIPSSKVSRQHCGISREGSEYFIEDLGSPNGVWRDGAKITKEKIQDGDEFMISDEVLKFVFKSPGRK